MKNLLPLFILILAFTAFGQIEATTTDGKKVILKKDGTWEYVVEKLKNEVKATNKIEADNYSDVLSFSRNLIPETKKSEFETESEYKIRLRKFVKEKQFNGKPIAEICFDAKPLVFYYKAESQRFTATFYGLEYLDRSYSSFSMKTLDFDFSMSPENAKTAKPLIKFFIFGFPVENNASGIGIVPTRIIAVNSDSNEIYLDKKIENFLSEKEYQLVTKPTPVVKSTEKKPNK